MTVVSAGPADTGKEVPNEQSDLPLLVSSGSVACSSVIVPHDVSPDIG